MRARDMALSDYPVSSLIETAGGVRMHALRKTATALVVSLVAVLPLLSGCGGSSTQPADGFGSIAGSAQQVLLSKTARSVDEPVLITIESMNLSTQAAEDGDFAIDRVPPGLHTLVARTSQQTHAISVLVKPGTQTMVGSLILGEAGSLSGVISAADTGTPIKGAQVTITSIVETNYSGQAALPVRVTTTDTSGSYDVDGLPIGDHLVMVNKNGYRSRSSQVTIGAGSVTSRNMALSAMSPAGAGSVAGTVWLRIDGGSPSPLGGVMVRFYSLEDPAPPPPGAPLPESDPDVPPAPPDPGECREYYTFTGPDGRYRLDGLPAGVYHAEAVRPGLNSDDKQVTISRGSSLTAEFRLVLHTVQACAIEGTVVDGASGQPLTETWVAAVLAPTSQPKTAGTRSAGSSTNPGIVITPNDLILYAKTDSQGRYRLLVPMETSSAVACTDGYIPEDIPVTPIPSGSLTVDFRMQKLTQNEFVLSGRVDVRDSQGNLAPAKGYKVGIIPQSPSPIMGVPAVYYEATTDEDGNYSITLWAGLYNVAAGKGEPLSERVLVRLYEDKVQNFVIDG